MNKDLIIDIEMNKNIEQKIYNTIFSMNVKDFNGKSMQHAKRDEWCEQRNENS